MFLAVVSLRRGGTADDLGWLTYEAVLAQLLFESAARVRARAGGGGQGLRRRGPHIKRALKGVVRRNSTVDRGKSCLRLFEVADVPSRVGSAVRPKRGSSRISMHHSSACGQWWSAELVGAPPAAACAGRRVQQAAFGNSGSSSQRTGQSRASAVRKVRSLIWTEASAVATVLMVTSDESDETSSSNIAPETSATARACAQQPARACAPSSVLSISERSGACVPC